MDAQGLVVHLIQNTVILSTAVELGVRWKELAEKLGKLSNSQISAFEAPHRGKNGEVSAQVSICKAFLLWMLLKDFSTVPCISVQLVELYNLELKES